MGIVRQSLLLYQVKKTIRLEGSASPTFLLRQIENIFFKGKKQLTYHLFTIINSSRVVIFLEGDEKQHKLLKLEKNKSSHCGIFNVLKDEEINIQLKIFSNCKTYPKIFTDGKLVGGSNVLKKLFQRKRHMIFPNTSTLDYKLDKLIAREKVVLFIKGTPTKPKCILSYYLTKFFQWPTYPQIFFQGKFAGGFDTQFYFTKC